LAENRVKVNTLPLARNNSLTKPQFESSEWLLASLLLSNRRFSVGKGQFDGHQTALYQSPKRPSDDIQMALCRLLESPLTTFG